jgi:hypothetical protein
MGICKDEVIENYVRALAGSAGPEERLTAARKIAHVALVSNDMKAVARALKALRLLLPLDPGVESSIDQRLLVLADNGTVAQNAELAWALALFIHGRTQERVSVARPYVPTLLKLLTEDVATTGAYSYYALMIVAERAP